MKAKSGKKFIGAQRARARCARKQCAYILRTLQTRETTSTMATSSPPADGDLIEMIVDDEVLSFSKALLMQSSPFFQHTFTDGQPKKKRVVISGVSGQTFKHLLGYMKSGKLELSCNNIADIFHAACKLQMPDIIRQCIEMEARSSAVGRQIILYKAAKRVNNVEEMNAALYRMVSNFTLVTQSDEFLELDAKDVCELLSCDVLSCERELDVFNAARRWLNHKVDTRLALTSRLMYCVRFPLMSLMDLSHCVEADTPPGLQDDHNVRVMILSAVCFWVAKAAGKEAEVGHLSCMPRHYIKKDAEVSTDGMETAMTCGRSEQPTLLSVTLGAAKTRLLPAASSKIEEGTQELHIASVLESGHLNVPEHSIEQEASLSLLSSTAECDCSMDSVAPTVCESSVSNIFSSEVQATCPSTQESDGASVTQDTQCTYSPSDFCSRSDDDKDQLSSQSVDSVILHGFSGGDIVHRDYVSNLKTKLLLSSQRGVEHEVLFARSPLLSEQPKADFLVVSDNPENSAIPSASVSAGVEHNFSDSPVQGW
ncbi:hypothetical protein V5799_025521 [Amblyomma americanum]|uniref:BTB domain-containing protein n=1 Tax=Amblyomma americanum TaxID=6943 RepID=A0AAQ4E999_AMBAM